MLGDILTGKYLYLLPFCFQANKNFMKIKMKGTDRGHHNNENGCRFGLLQDNKIFCFLKLFIAMLHLSYFLF